jgi:hypothetical protein
MADLVGTAAKLCGFKAKKLRILKTRPAFHIEMKSLCIETLVKCLQKVGDFCYDQILVCSCIVLLLSYLLRRSGIGWVR